jgi:hypothetical protein
MPTSNPPAVVNNPGDDQPSFPQSTAALVGDWVVHISTQPTTISSFIFKSLNSSLLHRDVDNLLPGEYTGPAIDTPRLTPHCIDITGYTKPIALIFQKTNELVKPDGPALRLARLPVSTPESHVE